MKLFRRKDDNAGAVRLQRNQKLVQSMQLAGSQIFTSENIALGNLIGTGGFAKVYHCSIPGVADTAVCKAINAEKIDDEAAYLLTNECTIWSKLKHDNIVQFYGLSWTSTSIMLLCQFMPGGSLLDAHEQYRKEKRSMPQEGELIDQLSQVASGMVYLHAMDPPVLHRDLKSANILLRDEVGATSACEPRLAIADFGLARYQELHKNMTAETGSYRWMAPEVIRHEMYDWRCDVYSFAVLAWEMVTYDIPFDNLTPVQAAFAVAKEAKRPAIPDSCPASVRQLLEKCWHQEARFRPAFARIDTALAEEAAIIKGMPAGGEPQAVAPAEAN